jgi:hypothetical protein
LQADIELAASQEESVRAMKNLVRESEDERNELEGYLLSRDNPAYFLELLEDLGDDSGVRVTVSALTEESAAPKGDDTPMFGGVGDPRIHVQLEAVGGFAELYHFVTLLEHMPYAATVRTVRLGRTESASLWEAIVGISVYTR